MLKPYKFVVQAIMIDVGDDGVVTGEAVAQPVQLFGVDAIHEYADAFPSILAQANAEKAGLQVVTAV